MSDPLVPAATNSTHLAPSATAVDEAPAAEAPPEPLTPAKVTAWNRYVDRYLVGGFLLLVFVASTRPIVSQSVWSLLRAGERISSGAPISTDTLSYTRNGERWINIPWTFEVVNWQIFDLGRRLFAGGATGSEGDFAGASAVVVFNALLSVLAGWLLLQIRRPGPGQWWTIICAVIALGGFVFPGGDAGLVAAIGGLSVGRVTVDPRTWGLLLLVLQLLLLHRAANLGRSRALWSLPLVLLIWANVDETFFFGLLVQVAWCAGFALDGLRRGTDSEATARPKFTLVAGTTAACLLACFATPSTYHAVTLAAADYYEPILRLFKTDVGLLTADRVGFFGPESQEFAEREGPGTARLQMAFYLIIVWLGALSFAVNWRRFSTARFLAYVLASVVWASQIRFGPFFGAIYAAVLSLNGQEWYQSRFGVEGKLGLGWKLWSDGGRSLTIIGLFLLLAIGITGFSARTLDTLPFGVGYDESQLSFDTAQAVQDLKLKGRVLNLTLSEGDALLWRAPEYQSFVDSRRGVFPTELRKELETFKGNLVRDERDAWEAFLKKYGGDDPGITSIIVSPQSAQGRNSTVFQALMSSVNWVPLYDGGNAVLFGRMDKDTVDTEIFKAQRLDPNAVVYKRGETLPRPDRPPTRTSWIDVVLPTRYLSSVQPQVMAAERWLTEGTAAASAGIEPARCFMAIRAARRALAKNPDDWRAHTQLQYAYQALLQSESQILAQSLKAQSMPTAYQAFRMRQWLSALNLAVETAPPPKDDIVRDQVAALNFALAQLYERNRDLDLWRDHLEAARDLVPPGSVTEEFEEQFGQLNETIGQIQQQIDNVTAEQGLGPLQRFEMAVNQGLDGMAIDELLAAENTGVNPALVRGILVDLYCKTGQPDKAFSLVETADPGDPNLGTAPGIAAYRQGTVYFLLGYYDMAAQYWEHTAVAQLRAAQSMQAITAAQVLLMGEPLGAVRGFLEISGSPGSPGYLATQAEWEAEIGLCKLESGALLDVTNERGEVTVQGAASHFKNALRLQPNLPIRGLLEYYLEKIGAEIPARPTDKTAEPAAGGNVEKPAADNNATPKAADGHPKSESAPADAPKPESGQSDKPAVNDKPVANDKPAESPDGESKKAEPAKDA